MTFKSSEKEFYESLKKYKGQNNIQ